MNWLSEEEVLLWCLDGIKWKKKRMMTKTTKTAARKTGKKATAARVTRKTTTKRSN